MSHDYFVAHEEVIEWSLSNPYLRNPDPRVLRTVLSQLHPSVSSSNYYITLIIIIIIIIIIISVYY